MNDLPISLPRTDQEEVVKVERICAIPVTKLGAKLKDISRNATDSEKECLDVYDKKKVDRFGYFEDFYKLWSNYKIRHLEEELSQARKLIAELVKMGKFYADKNNYAGRRSKSDIFSNIIGDNTIYPDRTAFGGRYARDVLSNNKDIIEKLTKE